MAYPQQQMAYPQQQYPQQQMPVYMNQELQVGQPVGQPVSGLPTEKVEDAVGGGLSGLPTEKVEDAVGAGLIEVDPDTDPHKHN